jgi:hypothetical protein
MDQSSDWPAEAMMINQQYLLLALALILMITNCLGAFFSLRRNFLSKHRSEQGTAASLDAAFRWSRGFRRFAVVEGALIVLLLVGAMVIDARSIAALVFPGSIISVLRSIF